jgi:L-amino acid N-acyltransferase YncA
MAEITEISIRDATLADVPFLVDGNAALALETERKTLDRRVLELGVRAVFAEPRRGFYLVAERAQAKIAGLLVTVEWSDWRNANWWWIQSVYVSPSARRSGAFKALYAEVERRARAEGGVAGLRLYVEEGNVAARATYAALELEDSGYRLLQRSFVDFNASSNVRA